MILIFLLTASIFSTNANIDQPLSVNPNSDSYFFYADTLFDEGHFDAAILEFKRYMFYNPQSGILDYALFRIGQSHFYSYRGNDAQKSLEQLLRDYPQSPFKLHARFMLGKTFMDSEDFARARNEFRLITKSNTDKKLSAQAQYLRAWSFLSERDWYTAVAEFRKVAQFQSDSPLSAKARRLADMTLEGIRLPRKSPTLARWMSTLLPGSGQIYAGEITNG